MSIKQKPNTHVFACPPRVSDFALLQRKTFAFISHHDASHPSFFVVFLHTAGKKLNEYISHFETLSYDTRHVHENHRRARRSVTNADHQIYLKFRAHGRPFHLRLRRDLSTFADNLVVDTPQGVRDVDTSHIYSGELLGDASSHVFGSIIDGVFTGKIHTERDAFYVEHAKYYFPNGTYKDHGFHSVIYNENHVDDPYAKHRTGELFGFRT